MTVDWSAVVPALDEAERIAGLIRALRSAGMEEVVVADGGSRDETRARAEEAGAGVVETEPGRGIQLAAGVAATRGRNLWIVHADTTLHQVPLSAMATVVQGGDAGAFRLRIEHPARRFRWIERGAALRNRWTGIPYGDQGLFLSRELYERAGGFPAWPLMEDVELGRRLRAAGARIRLLPVPLGTDARRWLADGALRRTLANWSLAIRFQLLGADPWSLAGRYPPPGQRSAR